MRCPADGSARTPTSRPIATSSPIACSRPQTSENRPHVTLHPPDRIMDRSRMRRDFGARGRLPASRSIVAAVISTANSSGPISSCRSRARSARSSACNVSSRSFSRWFCAATDRKPPRHEIEAIARRASSGGPCSGTVRCSRPRRSVLECGRQVFQRPQRTSDDGADQQCAQCANPAEHQHRVARMPPRPRRFRWPGPLAGQWSGAFWVRQAHGPGCPAIIRRTIGHRLRRNEQPDTATG